MGDFVTDWTVGLTVKVPLFTGGRIGGSVRSAAATAEDARLTACGRPGSAPRSTPATHWSGSAPRPRAWAANQGTVGQAERAYAIADVRYREGISTQTELADARLLLEQARANRATAGRTCRSARVRVALLTDLPLAQGGYERGGRGGGGGKGGGCDESGGAQRSIPHSRRSPLPRRHTTRIDHAELIWAALGLALIACGTKARPPEADADG